MTIFIIAFLLVLFLIGLYLLMMLGSIGWLLLALILLVMVMASIVVWS